MGNRPMRTAGVEPTRGYPWCCVRRQPPSPARIITVMIAPLCVTYRAYDGRRRREVAGALGCVADSSMLTERHEDRRPARAYGWDVSISLRGWIATAVWKSRR
jgi:hypothetical protein